MRWGTAPPTVKAPTRLPTASPRSETNQLAASFMAGGYVPAMARPVTKRQARTSGSESMTTSSAALTRAPTTADSTKRRRAPTKSASVRIALRTVPTTKPSVTAIDSQALASVDSQDVSRAGMTAVAENHRDSAPSSARQIHASIRQRMTRTLGRRSSACQGAPGTDRIER